MHGSVGLGGGVEGRWDAVTGLTAVVAVPVVNGAVLILVCSNKHNGKQDLVIRNHKRMMGQLFCKVFQGARQTTGEKQTKILFSIIMDVLRKKKVSFIGVCRYLQIVAVFADKK